MEIAAKLDNLYNLFREEKLAHVYLVETNNLDQAVADLIILIKKFNCENDYIENCQKCNLCNLIEQNYLPSFIVIEPDGINIKKEQVLELKRKFSFKPIYTKNNVYIIRNADKLNGASANTMLKFIEEPNENVIGFLITTNLNNCLPTIKSRCEVISLMYDEAIKDIDENIKNTAIEYLKKIELEKANKIMYNKDVILNNYSDRKDIEEIFKVIFQIYMDSLENKDSYDFLNHLKDTEILARIKILTKFLDDINSNANLELLMDKFVIELSDINESI